MILAGRCSLEDNRWSESTEPESASLTPGVVDMNEL